MKHLARTTLVILAGLICAPALAEWTAKAEAGLVSARGNSHTDTANTKFDVTRKYERWKHSAGGTGVYASDDSGATAQRWEARAQSEYDLASRGFWFGAGRYEEDRFSGFEYQASLSTGLGWRFFDDPVTKLSAQAGVGYKMFTTRTGLADDGITPIPGVSENDLMANGRIDFERALTSTAKLIDQFLVESGPDNTFVQNQLSFQVDIMSSLALAVGYTVRYNTQPASGFRTTDTLTTLNLVYELE